MSLSEESDLTLKWGPAVEGTASGQIGWSADLTGLDFSPPYTFASFEAEVDAAFTAWENVAAVDFIEVDASSADVFFSVGVLDDVAAAGVAWISYFDYGDIGVIDEGRVTMDGDRLWSPDGEGPGSDFFAVALHEIGHILGLSHIFDDTEIMNPVVRVDELGDKDIAAIQSLYGTDGSGPEEPESSTPLSVSSGASDDDGGGGGAGALLLGLLGALFAFFFGGPTGAAVAFAGRVPDETGDADDSDGLPDLDPDFDLPQIMVHEHAVYLEGEGHAHGCCDCDGPCVHEHQPEDLLAF
ncbi:matrixin family metalloprotease [Alphaproteobacteria bacterium GH1-50]|uniref:Matrixin family metalloprotease n=1 Tax=Kangsaoukella pontilimi TaxID=2691042 RepID=A0A7C9MLI5_9RHOB|nr:matrixin family metalloprotease [Kangsaoukella pontilimi]MXQ09275.1 matrixin family metalloprotease [Kangsaoukella pontilimi]